MTLPGVISQERTAELRGAPAPRPAGPPPGRRFATLRRMVRGNLARLEPRLFPETRARLELTNRRMDELERWMATYRELPAQLEIIEHRETNSETKADLIRDELGELQRIIDDLGFAIAPGACLVGAGPRLAELRERVNGLDRRLRKLAEEVDPGTQGAHAAEPAAPHPETSGPRSALFDYIGFERRFRGDPAEVADMLWSRYGELLSEHGPVLDVGCGRGELLTLLGERGVPALGVDADRVMVDDARARRLDVRLGDANDFLRAQPAGSLGAIIATHVVEHLELDALVELLDLAVSRLRPGGVLIAETPNPASLIVLGNSYVLDPTHVRPLHPSLMVFLCEGAGFRDVRLRFFAPAESYHLPPVAAPDAPDWVAQINGSFERLNEVLFGAQDYAVVATTPD